ncbi:MFS transporter [Rubeoparvulum massiliense]|uniref:MFS transporter n=1 Tax=Rubeoparvulum massiliense TaxID=1631346 RepID=UPI00065E40C0|nr:MFS transporter [Rubeoparvulum massiliense]
MGYLLELRSEFQGYSRNIRLFFLGNFLNQVGMGIYAIMYNLYIQALGYPNTVNGSIISIQSLASALILIPIGMVSDRVGRKKVMLIGGWLVAISLLFRAIFEQENTLLIFAFMTGIFSAFISVASIPLLAENSRVDQRTTLFSYNFAIVMVAQVLGNLSGGLLTDFFQWFGISPIFSYRITLLFGTFLCISAMIPLLMIAEKPQEQSSLSTVAMFKQLLRDWSEGQAQLKIIFLYGIAQLIIGLGSGLVIPYLNLYFHDRFAVDNWVIGMVVSLGQAATAVAMMMGPFFVRRWGEVKTVVVLQLTSIPFLLLTGFTTNFYLAALGFFLRQALMNAGNPIQQALIMGAIDDRHKGLANSVGQMVFMVGWSSMGPLSTTIVVQQGAYWGYVTVFSITSFLYVVGSLFFYMVFYKRLGLGHKQVVKEEI